MGRLFSRLAPAIAGLSVLVWGVGCANIESVMRARENEQNLQRDLLKFYERQSDAYFILAYEYYTLAKEAEDRNEPQTRIDDYRAKAMLCKLHCQELKRAAGEIRRRYAVGQEPEPPIGQRPVALEPTAWPESPPLDE